MLIPGGEIHVTSASSRKKPLGERIIKIHNNIHYKTHYMHYIQKKSIYVYTKILHRKFFTWILAVKMLQNRISQEWHHTMNMVNKWQNENWIIKICIIYHFAQTKQEMVWHLTTLILNLSVLLNRKIQTRQNTEFPNRIHLRSVQWVWPNDLTNMLIDIPLYQPQAKVNTLLKKKPPWISILHLSYLC